MSSHPSLSMTSSRSSPMPTISALGTSLVPFPVPTISNDPDAPSLTSSSYLTTSSSSIIACSSLMAALMYLAIVSWGYRLARQNPRPLNKTSGPMTQKYAPVVYGFMVLSSISEASFASWLIIQYNFNNNYPNDGTRSGVGLLLFASIWTFLTATTHTILFLHPKWSKQSISSIGGQAIWLFLTWLFWVVGAGIVNSSIPGAIDSSDCRGVVHCVQLRLLFSIAVVESLVLSASMAYLSWLAWQSWTMH